MPYSDICEKGMINLSRVGVSTACFYPADTFDSLCEILSTGTKKAEVFLNSQSELTHEKILRFRRELAAHDAKIVSFHPYTSAFESLMFFSEYTKRIDDGIEMYKRFFDGAAELGAKYFVFHGERNIPTFSRGLSSDSVICEAYGRLISEANNAGLIFTQENVNNLRSQSADYIHKLRELVPELRFTFDLKQAYRAGVDYSAVVDAMGDRLVHVHINDFGEKECCLPFTGDADLAGLSKQLKTLGYTGDFILEVYRTNFGQTHELCDCFSKLEALFD